MYSVELYSDFLLMFSEYVILLISSLLFVSVDVNSRDFSVLLVVFSSTDCFTTCTAGVIQDPVVGVLFLYLFASILLGMQEFLI